MVREVGCRQLAPALHQGFWLRPGAQAPLAVQSHDLLDELLAVVEGTAHVLLLEAVELG